MKPKLSQEEEDDLDKHGEPDFVEKPEDLESKIQRRIKQISMITNKTQAVSKVKEEVSSSPTELVAIKSDPEVNTRETSETILTR